MWLAVSTSVHRGHDVRGMAYRVLIVDDHAGFRSTARALLEAEGFEVVGEAEDGVSGLRAARELHPDIVLLDVQLPDFDGFEVLAPASSQRLLAGRHPHLEPRRVRLRAARAPVRRTRLRAESRALGEDARYADPVKTRTAVALWTLALAAAAVSTWIVSTTGHADAFTVRSALSIAVALTFVAAGVVLSGTGGRTTAPAASWCSRASPGSRARSRRRTTRSSSPSRSRSTTSRGRSSRWLVLAYPTGRLEDRSSKVIVGAAFAVTIILRPLWTLFSDLDDVHREPPGERVPRRGPAGSCAAILHVEQAFALALIAVALWVLRARWLAASPPLRRTLTPVFLSFGITVVILAVAVFLEASGVGETQALYSIALVALLTVPLGFAVGLLRTRLARAGVSALLVELDDPSRPVNLRDALARALGDPSLEVAYWLPDSREYVDSRGRPMPWPLADGEPRHATVVERDGGPVAALIHDVSVLDDPALLEAVGRGGAFARERAAADRAHAVRDAAPRARRRAARPHVPLSKRRDVPRRQGQRETTARRAQRPS